jgi:hypothetical protein
MSRNKKTLTQKVRGAYCQDTLTRILTLPEDEFGAEFGMQTIEAPQRWRPAWLSESSPQSAGDDFYHFRDNSSPVLAVAHLDTVVRPKGRVPHFRGTRSGPFVRSGALDDRLGAYVILDLLPKMGITCDWLFTTGEEMGQSTASSFTPGKEYDHVIEFDRGGTDVVMYQYDDAASRKLVQASGAAMGHGSFSDIAYLEHLRVKCLNWGVGYEGNYHSADGFAYLDNTFAMVAKYLRFHALYAGMAMPHEPAPEVPYYSSYSLYGSGSYHGAQDEWPDCDMCGAFGTVDPEMRTCTICLGCQDCGEYSGKNSEDPDYDPVKDCQCYYPANRQALADDGGTTITYYPANRQALADDGGTTITYEEYLARRPAPAARVYNEDGYNENGYDANGRDRDGYNENGYDANGRDRDGYNKWGNRSPDTRAASIFTYNKDGYNKNGYDASGWDRDGYDMFGRDQDCRDRDGYDVFGRDEDGYNKDGYNVDGHPRPLLVEPAEATVMKMLTASPDR